MLIHQYLKEWFDLWLRAVGGEFERQLWILLFYLVIWSLWSQRNRVVLNKTEIDWAEFCYLVKLRLGFWLKGWNQDVPFNLGEVATKLECVRLWRKRKEPRQPVAWCVPPSNRLKSNVDGSARGKQGLAGIGGILRNDQGNGIVMFAASVGKRLERGRVYGHSICT